MWVGDKIKVPCLSPIPLGLGWEPLEVAPLTPWQMKLSTWPSEVSSFEKQQDQHSPHTVFPLSDLKDWPPDPNLLFIQNNVNCLSASVIGSNLS